MGTNKTSQHKKNYLWNHIIEQSASGLGYNEEKLIAEFILDCNSSRKTALEFIKAFETAERIIRKEGKIYSLQFFNRDISLIELKEEDKKEESEGIEKNNLGIKMIDCNDVK